MASPEAETGEPPALNESADSSAHHSSVLDQFRPHHQSHQPSFPPAHQAIPELIEETPPLGDLNTTPIGTSQVMPQASLSVSKGAILLHSAECASAVVDVDVTEQRKLPYDAILFFHGLNGLELACEEGKVPPGTCALFNGASLLLEDGGDVLSGEDAIPVIIQSLHLSLIGGTQSLSWLSSAGIFILLSVLHNCCYSQLPSHL